MFILILVCLALQLRGQVGSANTADSKLARLSGLHSPTEDPWRSQHRRAQAVIGTVAPGSLDTRARGAGPDLHNRNTSPPATPVTQLLARHRCAKFTALHPYLYGSLSEAPSGVKVCSECGAVVEHTFTFLHEHFAFADCRNKTLLSHKSEALYCSVLTSHWACMVGPRPGQPTGLQESDGAVRPRLTLAGVQASLPTLAQMSRAVDFLCRMHRRTHLDMKCALGELDHVKVCIHQDVRTIFERQPVEWTYGALDPCRQLEVTAMCMYETLEETCSEEVARAMTGLLGSYLRDPGCSLSTGVPTGLGYSQWLVVCSTLVVLALSHVTEICQI